MSDDKFFYIGTELEIFAQAVKWKAYWISRIWDYLGPTVLEVGAGIGGTTAALCNHAGANFIRWVGLEPDPKMAQALKSRKEKREFPDYCDFQPGDIQQLAKNELFDSIIYIDVLEHIEDDTAQILYAAQHIVPGGYLIVLGPAHQWLFSKFDAEIGHYRRYNRKMLRMLTPEALETADSFYLDSMGIAASVANRILLRSPMPTLKQIKFWDTFMIPLSRLTDPLLGRLVGKSIVQVWRRK